MNHLRHAVRALLRSPGFTAVAVLTLALGIGVNTAIFSVVDAVLLEPLPYAEPDDLVAIFEAPRSPTSPSNFLDWRQRDDLFSELVAAHPWSPVLRGDGRPEQVPALKATPDLFRLLGAEAALGSTFPPETADLDPRVVVLGHDLWQRRFGADPQVVGRELSLDGENHTVIGVMPPGFAFPPFWATGAELWAPLPLAGEAGTHGRYLRVFARLQPGVGVAAAQRAMDVVAARREAEQPLDYAGLEIAVESLREPVVGDVRGALLVLMATVALVLLVACANVANLCLARAASRRREIAVRTALGAGRFALLRGFLVESLLLAAAGGAGGLLLGVWGVELLVALAPVSLPRLDAVALDGTVLGFACLLALVTSVAFGVLPAARALSWDLRDALLRGGRLGSLGGGQRLRSGLVVAQMALALVLLAGAGLLVRSLAHLWQLDPGFRTEGVVAVDLNFAGTELEPEAAQRPFFDRLLAGVRELPEVESAALVNHLPIGGDVWGTSFQVEGHPSSTPAEAPRATMRTASDDLFATLGVPILAGRGFDGRDRAEGAAVVVIGESAARRFWGERDPVGERVRLGVDPGDPEAAVYRVVGVVGDVREGRLSDDPQPAIWFPYGHNPVGWFTQTTLVVAGRGGADPSAAVQSRVAELAPELPVPSPRGLGELVSVSLGEQRFNTFLLSLFSALALLLATLGVYGLMSYTAAERRAEIGVRLALGARRGQILRMMIGRGLVLAAAGGPVGLVGALLLARGLSGQLHGVGPADPVALAGGMVLLTAAVVVAAWVPARKASRVDPLTSLRGSL